MSNIINDFKGVPQTFSSWDSCMSKAYCKWPVIAGIIVAGLIVVSILWCVASCICCGASLCTSCVQCLTCFSCCGACKSGGRGGSRHKDDYSQMPPTPYNGYQPPPAPMMQYQQPQFASFDASNKAPRVHEDSLPAMPSWNTAATHRVEDHSEPAQGYGRDVEMGRMAPPRTTRGGYSQLPPNVPVSPVSSARNQHYFEDQRQPQPYDSDLGAQRMPMNNNTYDNYSAVPLSPAPTYATHPPQNQNMFGAAVPSTRRDHFASGAVSPTPREYNSRAQSPLQPQYHQAHPQSYQNTRSPPPESTRYEASDYNNSYRPQSASPPILNYSNHPAFINAGYDPPQQQQQQQQQQQPSHQENDGTRPPSLLQIGRKPLNGSQREV